MGMAATRFDQARLVKELDEVRRRRVDRVFDRLDKQGPLKVPRLRAMLPLLQPDLWAKGMHAEALQASLEAAMEKLSSSRIIPDSDMSYRRAARIMYQLEPVPDNDANSIRREKPSIQEYAIYSRYIQEYMLSLTDADLVKLSRDLRRQLASLLLKEEERLNQPNPQHGDDHDVHQEPNEHELQDEKMEKRKRNKPDVDDFPNSQYGYIDLGEARNIIVGNNASMTIHGQDE